MAISSELSSEIAISLFAEKERSPEEMDTLKRILFEVHSTLQSLSDAERREREAASAARRAATNQSQADSCVQKSFVNETNWDEGLAD